MKIGIVVYSQTEHTYSVALKLKEKFIADGKDAEIERVVPAGEVHPGSKDIKFKNLPDISKYDGLIFGAPVHAFSLAPTMKAYLEGINTLENKKIACFVTKGAPMKWTGGTRAIGQMKKIVKSKGGSVIKTEIIVWNKSHDKSINELVQEFSAVI